MTTHNSELSSGLTRLNRMCSVSTEEVISKTANQYLTWDKYNVNTEFYECDEQKF